MLSTAYALIEATSDSIMDEEVMGLAGYLTHNHNEMSNEEFAKGIYLYSCAIASLAVDKATKILLTESQVKELMESIDEMESIGDEVINGK